MRALLLLVAGCSAAALPPAQPAAPDAVAFACSPGTSPVRVDGVVPCAEVDAPRWDETYPWFSPSRVDEAELYACRGVRGTTGPVLGRWRQSGGLHTIGQCRDGVRDGAWQFLHADGRVFATGIYRAGRRHDVWRRFWADGSIGEESYRDGVKHGADLAWHVDGKLGDTAHYRAGQLHGIAERKWSDGSLLVRGAYDQGRRDGLWTWYRDDGGKLREGSYHDGKRHGIWRSWNDDGTLRDVTVYSLDQVSDSAVCPPGGKLVLERRAGVDRVECGVAY